MLAIFPISRKNQVRKCCALALKTARLAQSKMEEATRANLKAMGYPLREDVDRVLMRLENDWSADKTERRAFVARTHRIILLIGDDLNDFVSGARTLDPAFRRELVQQHLDRFGREWFLVPNLMYGSWDKALFEREGEDLNYKEDFEQIRARKYEQLKPFRE